MVYVDFIVEFQFTTTDGTEVVVNAKINCPRKILIGYIKALGEGHPAGVIAWDVDGQVVTMQDAAFRRDKKLRLDSEGKKQLLSFYKPRSIKNCRISMGLTQAEVAKRSGIPQPHISAIEKGERAIGIEVAKKLAKALEIDYQELL